MFYRLSLYRWRQHISLISPLRVNVPYPTGELSVSVCLQACLRSTQAVCPLACLCVGVGCWCVPLRWVFCCLCSLVCFVKDGPWTSHVQLQNLSSELCAVRCPVPQVAGLGLRTCRRCFSGTIT